jgi:hypothetical protein
MACFDMLQDNHHLHLPLVTPAPCDRASLAPMSAAPPVPTTAQTTLRVIQYNILADALCTGRDAGFASLAPSQLAWAPTLPATSPHTLLA